MLFCTRQLHRFKSLVLAILDTAVSASTIFSPKNNYEQNASNHRNDSRKAKPSVPVKTSKGTKSRVPTCFNVLYFSKGISSWALRISRSVVYHPMNLLQTKSFLFRPTTDWCYTHVKTTHTHTSSTKNCEISLSRHFFMLSWQGQTCLILHTGFKNTT
jgi:hypothetical protein